MYEQMDAVIFDLDGTLVDSMWVWQDVDKEFEERYQLVEPADFHDRMEGMSFTEVALLYLEVFPQLPYTLDELKDEWYHMAFHKYTCDVKLKEGAWEFLGELRRRGIRTGIATSNDRKLTRACLESLGIDGYIDTICTGCEVKVGKPSPDVYLTTAGKLGVDPKRCLVFEDIPNGILAGKRAGMHVCAVEDRFSQNLEEKKRGLADYYIQDYHQVMAHTYEVL